jgi:VanZ family protein
MGGLYYLSTQSNLAPPTLFGFQDKLTHAGAYGLLALLLTLALTSPGSRAGWAAVLSATLIATVYGISDEWHQSMVPGRDASLYDLTADAIGAFLGSALARFACRTPK